MWLLIAIAVVFGFIVAVFGGSAEQLDEDKRKGKGPLRCPRCGFKAVRPHYGQDFRRPDRWVCTQCGERFLGSAFPPPRDI